ncbi:hypothetical protein D0894_18175 [Pseudomonas monteilii]|uniref:Uncharacterized protein n=1 Tax=Pseudomonas monteilii TaxID=76759 RepID=A0A399M2Q6_9PSED|nr:hypothetical protein D0894_18175 [Pseudomonas monteilii]
MSVRAIGAALQPIAGKPAPTGTAQPSSQARSLWELACRRWAAQRPQSFDQAGDRSRRIWVTRVKRSSGCTVSETAIKSPFSSR